jgi:ribosomal protein S18 acetylase RimI-like enzyme
MGTSNVLRIEPFESAFLGEFTDLVNLHLASIPSGLPLSEAQVASALLERPFWDRHYEDEHDGRTYEERVVCVLDGDRLVAAADERWIQRFSTLAAGLDPGWVKFEDVVTVQWMVAAPDHPAAGRQLVDYLVEQAGISQRGVRISGRFLFGIGWVGMAETWPHLIQPLLDAGFVEYQRWAMFHLDTDASIRAVPPEGFTFRWDVDESKHEWELLAFIAREDEGGDGVGGEGGAGQPGLAGECQVWDVPDGARSDGRHPWTTIEWLGVEAPQRRRGLGQYLVQEQCRFQAGRGVRHVLLWTEPNDPDSAAALRLYARLGFQAGPMMFKLERTVAGR